MSFCHCYFILLFICYISKNTTSGVSPFPFQAFYFLFPSSLFLRKFQFQEHKVIYQIGSRPRIQRFIPCTFHPQPWNVSMLLQNVKFLQLNRVQFWQLTILACPMGLFGLSSPKNFIILLLFDVYNSNFCLQRHTKYTFGDSVEGPSQFQADSVAGM